MSHKIAIQFSGYEPTTINLPLQDESGNPFENLDYNEASELLEIALTGDADNAGWISAEIGGEHVRLADSFNADPQDEWTKDIA